MNNVVLRWACPHSNCPICPIVFHVEIDRLSAVRKNDAADLNFQNQTREESKYFAPDKIQKFFQKHLLSNSN
jgi:hypothetical protein